MSKIIVRPVANKKEKYTFSTFPWQIYKDDPLWVPPILSERMKVIDPYRGTFFKRGEAEFFIAWDDGKPVGTICAAEDPPTNTNRGTKECVFGFLETIDDYTVFEALVNQAAQWAKSRGLEALFGPFNLDYEDSYGVLIDGRDRPPAIMCGHTPEYYPGFMDRFGFYPARDQNIALAIDLNSPELVRFSTYSLPPSHVCDLSISGSFPGSSRTNPKNPETMESICCLPYAERLDLAFKKSC